MIHIGDLREAMGIGDFAFACVVIVVALIVTISGALFVDWLFDDTREK